MSYGYRVNYSNGGEYTYDPSKQLALPYEVVAITSLIGVDGILDGRRRQTFDTTKFDSQTSFDIIVVPSGTGSMTYSVTYHTGYFEIYADHGTDFIIWPSRFYIYRRF